MGEYLASFSEGKEMDGLGPQPASATPRFVPEANGQEARVAEVALRNSGVASGPRSRTVAAPKPCRGSPRGPRAGADHPRPSPKNAWHALPTAQLQALKGKGILALAASGKDETLVGKVPCRGRILRRPEQWLDAEGAEVEIKETTSWTKKARQAG